jgi:predicted nucleic acid-binding protein
MILIDTNILTRSAQPAHPQSAEAAQSVSHLLSESKQLCLVPQIIYEFWAVATRPVEANGLGLPCGDADAKVTELLQSFAFLPDVPAIFEAWRQLVRSHDVRGKPSHDARIVAAMNVHGVRDLLTFNAGDFQRYPGIQVLTPQSVLAVP